MFISLAAKSTFELACIKFADGKKADAFALLKVAAELNNPQACYHLGMYYYTGELTDVKDDPDWQGKNAAALKDLMKE
jgi:TPR repeat protein